MKRWQNNEIVVITGAAGGIGTAIIKALLTEANLRVCTFKLY